MPIVAVTGSAGKTTTKEILGQIGRCAGKKFFVSHGNQNTLLGVSLNILRVSFEHEVAVFEVGVSERGEMKALADLLRPTVAVITNIGHQHMDGLGSLADAAFEKRQIFHYFKNDNIGVINGDQALLSQVAYPHPTVRFGTRTTNQVQARKVVTAGSRVSFVLKVYKNKWNVILENAHVGLAYDALAAASVAHILDLPIDAIRAGILDRPVVTGRFERRQLCDGQGVLINDAYNASPESMKLALQALDTLDAEGEKIAVIGDMLGLGSDAPFWHRQIGRFLHKLSTIKRVILVGKFVEWTEKTAPLHMTIERVPSWREAVDCLRTALIDKRAAVLVKGSRNVGLSALVDACTTDVMQSVRPVMRKEGTQHVNL